ncbi:MAG: serine/threonine protein kinase, partial [Gemmataceae bacterium]|nr:serine/threonine protein kinase [Gemmataceae bacterium]
MGVVERVQQITGYSVLRKLGSGSYGDVYEGRTRGNRPVALKVIDRTRGEAEARLEIAALEAGTELSHPCLLQTFDTWTEPDFVVIAMELADGNLRQRLDWCRTQDKTAGIPPDELLVYAKEAGQALDYLHAQGKLHRDVKPDNILLVNTLTPPAHAKLGDCGLLREMGAEAATMTTRGTPAYIAPETWKRQTSPASDQYALAITYAELRLGRRPYPSGDIAALLEAVALYEPDLKGMEPRELEAVRRALSKTPAGRYPSCAEFVEALEAALTLRSGDFKPRGREIALANRRSAIERRPSSSPEIPIPSVPTQR